jgi:NADPH-dependent curcumin reductase CurA
MAGNNTVAVRLEAVGADQFKRVMAEAAREAGRSFEALAASFGPVGQILMRAGNVARCDGRMIVAFACGETRRICFVWTEGGPADVAIINYHKG